MSTLISQLPEEIRKKAEANKATSEFKSSNNRNVLWYAFIWKDSSEGFEYWDYIDKVTAIIDRRLPRNETIDLLVKLWEGKL